MLIAVVGGILWFAPWWAVLTLAVVVAAAGAAEVAAMCRAMGAPVPVLVVSGAAMAVCAVVPVGMADGAAIVVVLLAVVVGAGIVTLASGAPAPQMITAAAATVMAPLYAGLPLGALVWIHVVYGPRSVVFLIAMVAMSDTSQYFTGRAFGRRKLAPAVSPAKTVEGALGGVAAAAATGALLGPQWGQVASSFEGIALGAVIGVIGITGDLFESMLKRSAGVKDSSTLIPGHGGVLDRIDAYLFAIPVYLMFLRYAG